MKMLKMAGLALAVTLAGCGGDSDNDNDGTPPPSETSKKNVLFFLGDGMGITTLTVTKSLVTP